MTAIFELHLPSVRDCLGDGSVPEVAGEAMTAIFELHLPSETLASGKRWVSYYYNGRDEAGRRKEIPLGGDLNEAKRKWAELECRPAPVETGIMRVVFDRYAAEVIPTKALKTQAGNLLELARLRSVFDTAPPPWQSAASAHARRQYRARSAARGRGLSVRPCAAGQVEVPEVSTSVAV